MNSLLVPSEIRRTDLFWLDFFSLRIFFFCVFVSFVWSSNLPHSSEHSVHIMRTYSYIINFLKWRLANKAWKSSEKKRRNEKNGGRITLTIHIISTPKWGLHNGRGKSLCYLHESIVVSEAPTLYHLGPNHELVIERSQDQCSVSP